MTVHFDPFNHGDMETPKPQGKVVTINNQEFSHEEEEEAIEIEMTNFIQENVGDISRALIVVGTPTGELKVMGFGELDRASAIGMLSMAGFALGHEYAED